MSQSRCNHCQWHEVIQIEPTTSRYINLHMTKSSNNDLLCIIDGKIEKYVCNNLHRDIYLLIYPSPWMYTYARMSINIHSNMCIYINPSTGRSIYQHIIITLRWMLPTYKHLRIHKSIHLYIYISTSFLIDQDLSFVVNMMLFRNK